MSHPFRVFDPGDAARATGVMDLVLERGSFGGGTHPTTASCLAALAELAPLAGSVLDLGSGTGILAIAAIRLGAHRAVCVDVNPEAIESSRRNAIANGVADRVEHRCGSVDDVATEQFDLVVANIGGELLVDAASAVASAARSGGRLLLSGVLRDHAGELIAAYERVGCSALVRGFPGDFCTVLLSRGAGA